MESFKTDMNMDVCMCEHVELDVPTVYFYMHISMIHVREIQQIRGPSLSRQYGDRPHSRGGA